MLKLPTGSYFACKYIVYSEIQWILFFFYFYLVLKLAFKEWKTILKSNIITVSLNHGFGGQQWTGINWVILITWARCGYLDWVQVWITSWLSCLHMMVLLRCFISAYCSISFSRRLSLLLFMWQISQIPRGEHRHKRTHLVQTIASTMFQLLDQVTVLAQILWTGTSFPLLRWELHENGHIWRGIYGSFHHIPYHIFRCFSTISF